MRLHEELSRINEIMYGSNDEVSVELATDNDTDEIYQFLINVFKDIPSDVLDEELYNVKYNMSLIAKSNGKIIGCLLFSEESVCNYLNKTEVISINKSFNLKKLCNQNGLKGVVFAIDEEYRGGSLNSQFLNKAKSIVGQYEYIYGLVYSFLGTHNYWKRVGMKHFATVDDDGEIVEVYMIK